WGRMTRAVERQVGKQVVAIEGLEKRLDALERTRANPQIDLDGVAAAIAQVELLDARLDALDRRRVVPRVAMGGGMMPPIPPGAGGGGGGGARGGWNAGRGFGARAHIGPFSGPLGMGLLASLLPIGRNLIGSSTAVLGSLTGALGGA